MQIEDFKYDTAVLKMGVCLEGFLKRHLHKQQSNDLASMIEEFCTGRKGGTRVWMHKIRKARNKATHPGNNSDNAPVFDFYRFQKIRQDGIKLDTHLNEKMGCNTGMSERPQVRTGHHSRHPKPAPYISARTAPDSPCFRARACADFRGIVTLCSMAVPVHHSGLTAEELLALLPDGSRTELVRGAVIHMTPAGARHGAVTARIGRLLDEYVEAHGFGVCCGAETGFVLRRAPDTVRAPDAAVVAASRIPATGSRPPTGLAPPIWQWRWCRRGTDRPKSKPSSRSTSTPARAWSGLWSPSSARFRSAGRRTTFGCLTRTTTSTAATCCRDFGAPCDAFFPPVGSLR